MNIAIIGAGFCGLATAWHLATNTRHTIILFDSVAIGKGTSGIATGLLHGYVGARSRRNPRATEALHATHQLIKIAENAVGKSLIISKGILRLATTPEQQEDFFQCANTSPDVHWWSAEKCQSEIPGLLPYPGIFIESGVTVDCELYLQGLWLACVQMGVHFEQKMIDSLEELQHFDCIVCTTGASTKLLNLPITQIKGQLLELSWPEKLPPLPYALNSQAYLTPSSTSGIYIAGATFERAFNDVNPDLDATIENIIPKIESFFPAIHSARVISCRAGIRASAPGHQPLLKQVDKKTWVLTGMGAKGLLYHALYAQELENSLP